MSRLFDTILVVDWSARATPSPRRPSPDAIWIAAAGAGAFAPLYLRTRAEAAAWLVAFLSDALANRRRVLAGFDFPFGYPRGLAAALAGHPDAFALWSHLAARIEDAPDNRNNRFAVAAALNARLPGTGPFWGRAAGLDLPGLPALGTARAGHGLPERRLVETRLRSAQPCWKLFTTGSVGSQALLGIPVLHRLRAALAPHLAVWPFDTGLAAPAAPLVLAEIYPSLLAAEIRAATRPGEIRDAAQVRVTATALAALDATGALAHLFAAAPDLPPTDQATVAREEAWILGAGHEAAFREAARPPHAAAAPRAIDEPAALP
jgi:hypothetical protein